MAALAVRVTRNSRRVGWPSVASVSDPFEFSSATDISPSAPYLQQSRPPSLWPGASAVASEDPRQWPSSAWLSSVSRFRWRQELHADWRRRLSEDPGRFQSAILGVNPANEQRVRILIGDGEMFSRGFDSKMPRGFSSRILLFNVFECAFVLIDSKYHQAFVPAIRGIEVFPGRLDSDLSWEIGAVIIRWKRRYRLEFLQSTCLRKVGERGDRGVEFVDDVGETAVRVERSCGAGRRRV